LNSAIVKKEFTQVDMPKLLLFSTFTLGLQFF
jgi:hypothetical protein